MMKRFFMILLVCLLLAGCHPSTAVILSPETTGMDTSLIQTTVPTPVEPSQTTSPVQTESTQTTEPQNTTAPSTQTPTKEDNTPKETKPPKQPSSGSKETTPPATTVPTTVPAEQTEPSKVPEATEAAETIPEETQFQHPVYDISNHSVSSSDKSVIAEINRIRVENGLSELTLDKKLCALATIRGYECGIDAGSTRPDGRSWKTVLSDYSYGRRSKNAELRLSVSGGYNAEVLIMTWMNSDSHKEKLLDPEFTHVGIGSFYNGKKTYIVALFAA